MLNKDIFLGKKETIVSITERLGDSSGNPF